jgi:hypothetical protein
MMLLAARLIHEHFCAKRKSLKLIKPAPPVPVAGTYGWRKLFDHLARIYPTNFVFQLMYCPPGLETSLDNLAEVVTEF